MKSAFFEEGGSLSANISGGIGQYPGNIFGPFNSRITAVRLCHSKFSLSSTLFPYKSEICLNRRVSHVGGSLSANTLGGRGQFPATPVGVKRLAVSLFRTVLRHHYFVLS